MKTIKDFLSVADWQTLVVSLLAVGSTFGCHYFKVYANIPTALIGLAVVFPIVFSISAAYRRREEALRYLGGLKAHAVALYYAHRDWVPGDQNKKSVHVKNIRKRIEELLDSIRQYTLQEYGPLGREVLEHWGVYRCEDFGEIVFNMVEDGLLRKSEMDSKKDFENNFDFANAFDEDVC